VQAVSRAQAVNPRPRRRRIRPVPAAGAFLAAAGALLLLAGPASAADGPPPALCTTGSSCLVELNYYVTYTGSSGGHNGIAITPPPCIAIPAGDAHTGSQTILSLYGNTAPVPETSTPVPASTGATDTAPASTAPAATGPSASPTVPGSPSASPTALFTTPESTPTAVTATLGPQQQQILDQARTLAASNPPTAGEWYRIDGNPSATATAQQECASLPLYIWVPGGSRLPLVGGLRIPPETLAKLAYSQLTTAQLGQVTLNPKAASDTNLPTFLDVTLQPPARGVLSVTPGGDPYVWATAATPTGQAATVWARVTGLTITPGTAQATTFNQQRCSVAHLSADGRDYVLGSRYNQAEMAQVGVGDQIDCGVTYTAPGSYALSANVTWSACWAQGEATAAGPPANCKPVPGAGGLAPSTSAPLQVAVREIQTNNG
jgi:hypothetical protein